MLIIVYTNYKGSSLNLELHSQLVDLNYAHT